MLRRKRSVSFGGFGWWVSVRVCVLVCPVPWGQMVEGSHHFDGNSHFQRVQGLWVHFQSELQQSDIIMTSQHPPPANMQHWKTRHNEPVCFVGVVLLGIRTGYGVRSLGNNWSFSVPTKLDLVESVCDLDDNDKPDFCSHRFRPMIAISYVWFFTFSGFSPSYVSHYIQQNPNWG